MQRPVAPHRGSYNRRRLAHTSRAGARSTANPPPVLLRSGATMLQPSSSLGGGPTVAVRAAVVGVVPGLLVADAVGVFGVIV